MRKDQEKKVKDQMGSNGYTQLKSDPTKYSNGSTTVKWDSSNGFNHNGIKVRGYDNCMNHFNDKKKK